MIIDSACHHRVRHWHLPTIDLDRTPVNGALAGHICDHLTLNRALGTIFTSLGHQCALQRLLVVWM